MLEYESDPLLVVDARGSAVGLVTLRDTLRVARAGLLAERVAGQIMRPLPKPIPEDAPMALAAARLADGCHQALPLADPSGRVTALLTAVDAIDWAAERATHDLASRSEPRPGT